jgi:hypothetical protein
MRRLNQDGTRDADFNADDLGTPVLALAQQFDGSIIVGGGFNHYGSQPVYNLARLDSTGRLVPGFNAGSGPDFSVGAIRIQPDGKIIIGGDFRSFNGITKVNVARLDFDGNLDPTFVSNITTSSGSFVHGLAIQSDGKILAAGSFTMAGSGVTRRNLTRVQGDFFVTWKDGDAADKTITLPIVDDVLDEPDETATLTLWPLTGGAHGGAITNATLTIVDNDVPPAFTSGAPANGITNSSYNHSFTATGTPSPVFNLASGTLPPGLFLQSSGLLTGTPTVAGVYNNITIAASNGVAPSASQTVSITILSGGSLQFSSSTASVNEGAGSATVTVSRVNGSAGAATVNFSSFPTGSAFAGSDYIAVFGALNFAAGETSKTITVPIINDIRDEPDETFIVALTSASGSASLGTPASLTVTIVDDDPPPTISMGDAVFTEGNGGFKNVFVPVLLSDASGFSVKVSFSTSNGTAVSGSDYTAAAGSISIQPGLTSSQIVINLTGDTVVEPDENFFINLTNPQNVTIARGQGTVTIINDDNNGANPIDLQGFFVRQHYIDFLGREPDTAGLAYWTHEIEVCGTDAACIDLKRVNVSAAFFLSIEFQETGYLAERIYKAAYGDGDGISNVGPTHTIKVPIIRLFEFLNDSRTIASGVNVGVGNWAAQLEANKVAFTLDFVTRPRFTSAYPAMTPAQFVDTLFQRAGVTPAPDERTSIIGEFGAADNTNDMAARGRALRRVAESAALTQSEKNRAFVLMQYFGYMRRNPNDPQDTDYTGYDFWLQKLNEHNGNFVNAQMVKAFIDSIEYRKRFGP